MSTTKQSTSEMVKEKELTLDAVLPELSEVSKTETCLICGKKLKDHFYMDFFLHSKHTNKVEKYIARLSLLLGSTLNTYYKLKEDKRPSIFWGDKPIVETIIETFKIDPFLANQIPRLAAHYDSAEKNEFQHRSLGNTLLSNMTTKFRSICKEFRYLFKRYNELNSFETYVDHNQGFNFEEDLKSGINLIQTRFIINQAVEKNAQIYKDFFALFDDRAENFYQDIRMWFFDGDQIIRGFYEATEKFLKAEPYANMRKSMSKRSERPIYVQSKDANKLLKSRR